MSSDEKPEKDREESEDLDWIEETSAKASKARAEAEAEAAEEEEVTTLRGHARIALSALIVGAGISIAALILITKPEAKTEAPEKPKPSVTVTEVNRGAVPIKVPSQGIVTAHTRTLPAAEVAGVVVETDPRFDVGGEFQKDEIILRLDDSDYAAALANAEASEAQARLTLATEEGLAKQAVRDWKKLAGDEPPTSLAVRIPQLKSAQAALDAAVAAVAKAKRDVDRCSIKAPFHSRIVAKNIDLGSFANIGTPLLELEAIGNYEVRLPVPLEDFAFIDIPDEGDEDTMPKVTFNSTIAGEPKTWEGHVLRDEGGVDRSSRSVYLVARIGGEDDSDRFLKPGLFVRAQIDGVTLDDVIEIPRLALRDNDQVLVINDDRVHIRDVTVRRTGKETVVISEGLDNGDKICLTPLSAVVEDMPVKIEEPKAQTATNPVANDSSG